MVGALYRRAAPRSLALLAFLIFCLDDGHALSVTFIAARNAVVSCVLVWLGLGAHLRWRIHGWRAGAGLAPLLGALGLAAGEMGLGALAYLVAWELCERRPGWRRALAPTALLVAGYLVVYRLTARGRPCLGCLPRSVRRSARLPRRAAGPPGAAVRQPDPPHARSTSPSSTIGCARR